MVRRFSLPKVRRRCLPAFGKIPPPPCECDEIGHSPPSPSLLLPRQLFGLPPAVRLRLLPCNARSSILSFLFLKKANVNSMDRVSAFLQWSLSVGAGEDSMIRRDLGSAPAPAAALPNTRCAGFSNIDKRYRENPVQCSTTRCSITPISECCISIFSWAVERHAQPRQQPPSGSEAVQKVMGLTVGKIDGIKNKKVLKAVSAKLHEPRRYHTSPLL